MRRKLSGIIFTGIFLFLAGCSTNETETVNTEYTTITYMVPGYGGSSYAGKEQIEQIEAEHPDIKFDVQVYSEDQYYASLKTMLATGRGTDLFFVQPEYGGANGIAALAQAGYLEPVDDLETIKKAKQEKDESYLLTYDGKVYSVSIGTMGLGVAYNKKLFEQYGLQVPGTWKEFLDCCATFYEDNTQPIIMSGKDANTLQYGIYQIAANLVYRKDPAFDEKLRAGIAHFTDKGTWDEVLKTFFALYDKGYLGKEIMEQGSMEASRKFINQGVAMMFAGTGEAEAYIKTGDFGFFLLPAPEKEDSVVCCLGEIGGISLYSSSNNTRICKQILNEVYASHMESKAEKDKELDILFPQIKEAKEKGNVMTLCNQGWNNNVEHTLESLLGEYLSGHSLKVEEITGAMEKELRK